MSRYFDLRKLHRCSKFEKKVSQSCALPRKGTIPEDATDKPKSLVRSIISCSYHCESCSRPECYRYYPPRKRNRRRARASTSRLWHSGLPPSSEGGATGRAREGRPAASPAAGPPASGHTRPRASTRLVILNPPPHAARGRRALLRGLLPPERLESPAHLPRRSVAGVRERGRRRSPIESKSGPQIMTV